ncbi:GMC oxidoreductase [Robertmurraya sp.]|uniref:GMC oxidoreductase n=1 Tax=Robertmurraya sp. TaxID=2837525 RepID=UPI003704AEF6
MMVYLPTIPTSKSGIPPVCYPEMPENYLDYWIPTTPIEKMATEEYDVLIVGSGAGGSAALYRMCEQWKGKGKKIGIIEAGGLLLPTHAQNISTLEVERFQRYFLNPKISTPIGWELPQFPGARLVFALGGRTLFWSAVCPRMNEMEFELGDWPISYKELLSYYNNVEKVLSVTQEFTKDSQITDILLERLRENGFPQATPVPIATDISQAKFGKVGSDVFFSSIDFFARSLNLSPFDLAIYSRAVQVYVENNKATGVKVLTWGGKTYKVRAKNIILSTSTLETPRILLNSGIEGKAIGHYLVNHSFLEVNGNFDRSEFPENFGNLGILVPQAEEDSYQLQMYGRGGTFFYHERRIPLRDKVPFYLQGFGKVEPQFKNRVTLHPTKKDYFGIPKIHVDFSYSEKDIKLINMIQQKMEDSLVVMKGKKEEEICLRPPGLDYHEMGTCRMGHNSETSVTNKYGQVHNISGLFIADNSVLPHSGAANPTLTMMALAFHTADYISKR